MESASSAASGAQPPRAIGISVLSTGLTTTALTLFGVWAINQATDELNIMGWYVALIIPAGAVLVGLAAGSGYGLSAWWQNRRVSRSLYAAVVLLQMCAYCVAQYEEFRHLHLAYTDGTPVSFTTYFDSTTRSMTFRTQHESSSTVHKPLGVAGYAFRLLEVVGFTLGGLIVPLGLATKPYCSRCNVYMRTKSLGWLPAGARPWKVRKDDPDGAAAYEKTSAESFDDAVKTVARLGALSVEGRRAELDQVFAEHRPNTKEYQKLTCRVQVTLSTCPVCAAGQLHAVAHRGKGDKITRVPLATFPFCPAGLDAEGQETTPPA